MIETKSREKLIDDLYSEIAGIVEPGDLIFYITHNLKKTQKKEICDKNWRSIIFARLKPWCRSWVGLDRDDLDEWHTGIFCTKKKRKNHSRINLWIIHSTFKKGVHIEQLSPKQFSNKNINAMSRIEILHFEGINDEQRERIIRFAGSKLGSVFDRSSNLKIFLPYMFGIPNIWRIQNQYSCQQLALCSYAAAGIYFPHLYKSFPIFNIGRILGHPLGHPYDRVDPKYPYLMDHHLYRDPRFILKAEVFQDKTTNEIRIEKENLRKWSWDEGKRNRYIKKN